VTARPPRHSQLHTFVSGANEFFAHGGLVGVVYQSVASSFVALGISDTDVALLRQCNDTSANCGTRVMVHAHFVFAAQGSTGARTEAVSRQLAVLLAKRQFCDEPSCLAEITPCRICCHWDWTHSGRRCTLSCAEVSHWWNTSAVRSDLLP